MRRRSVLCLRLRPFCEVGPVTSAAGHCILHGLYFASTIIVPSVFTPPESPRTPLFYVLSGPAIPA